jgi:hypothetical protein
MRSCVRLQKAGSGVRSKYLIKTRDGGDAVLYDTILCDAVLERRAVDSNTDHCDTFACCAVHWDAFPCDAVL